MREKQGLIRDGVDGGVVRGREVREVREVRKGGRSMNGFWMNAEVIEKVSWHRRGGLWMEGGRKEGLAWRGRREWGVRERVEGVRV